MKQTNAEAKFRELTIIDSLLRDKAFAYRVARQLDSSYYAGLGLELPEPDESDSEAVMISHRNEMIATNIASFYAVDCSLNFISSKSGKKLTNILDALLNNKLDSSDVLIFNRFANATWKAGQPFRNLDRIERPIFRIANFLPPDEIEKDFHQVTIAGKKLSQAVSGVKDSSNDIQMEHLRKLLQDTSFAYEMAAYVDSSYSGSTAVITDTPMISKNPTDQKTATSIAGFYALECAINYFVTNEDILPSVLIKQLLENSLEERDVQVFARFANATWKAGQPFRDLQRITRRTFTPFYFLSKEDIDKDINQVRAAAQILAPYLD